MVLQPQAAVDTELQWSINSGRRKTVLIVLFSFTLGATLGFEASFLGFQLVLLYPLQDSGDVPNTACSPNIINPIDKWMELSRFPPPVFHNETIALCDAVRGKSSGWNYCLPISGRKDVPFCNESRREDLLQPQTRETRCFASVLHMLLMDVYEEIERLDLRPALLYGTLLGAVREKRVIPFTEDVDIGWRMTVRGARQLQANLARKGYHMLLRSIWRVCVAPTHPLAGNLYDAAVDLVQGPMEIPYVDLYEMTRVNESTWSIAEASPDQYLPSERIEPFTKVTIRGIPFNTIADPAFFLVREYGKHFMTPKRRRIRPKLTVAHHQTGNRSVVSGN